MKNDKLILLLYSIPYFYFAMWRDITHRVVWPYIVVVILLLTIRIALGRMEKDRIAYKGFWTTMVSTLLCIMIFQRGNLNKWNAYFGAFFPFPLMVAVIVIEMFIQMMKQDK